MKLSLFILITTVLLPATLGQSVEDILSIPASILHTTYNVESQIYQSGERALEQEIQNLKYGAALAIQMSEKYAGKAIEGFHEFTNEVATGLSKLNDYITDDTKILSEEIEKLARILSNYPEGVSLLNKMKGFINRTEDLLQYELKELEEKIEVPAKRAIEAVLGKIKTVREWGNAYLSKFNNKISRNGHKILEKLLYETSRSIKSCADITVKPIEKIFSYANETIAKGADVLKDVINSIQQCSTNPGNMIVEIMNCLKAVIVTGEDGYILIKRDIGAFEQKMATIALEAGYNLKCFITTAKEFQTIRGVIRDSLKKDAGNNRRIFETAA